jgi:hypothetical protein
MTVFTVSCEHCKLNPVNGSFTFFSCVFSSDIALMFLKNNEENETLSIPDSIKQKDFNGPIV